uniref:Uncharacterized protein n=1 Tax=Ascaris lumbricoides TaxID=6252 RepID=A0A0M3HMW8_ASCLU
MYSFQVLDCPQSRVDACLAVHEEIGGSAELAKFDYTASMIEAIFVNEFLFVCHRIA